jgi:beta propeller repeat protein
MRAKSALGIIWGMGSLVLFQAGATTAEAAPTPLVKFPISTAPGQKYFPKVDGDYVVWTDVAFAGSPPGSTTSNDAYAYHIPTAQQITLQSGPGYQDEPAISNGVAVWSNWSVGVPGSVDIVGRNLAGGGSNFDVTTLPGSQLAFEISGDLVVWQDDRTSPQQIRGRRLGQPAGSDFPISDPATYEQIYPDVSGDVVVWMSFQEPGDQGNIYRRDLTTGGVVPVTTAAGYQFYPKVSGRTVVWNDTRDGGLRVYGRNLDSGGDFPISSGVGQQYEVSIDGDLVVWRDDRTGVGDIWGRYLSGGPEFPITLTPDIAEDYPDVSGNFVVWQQTRDANNIDIYGILLPEPAVGGCAALVAGPLLLRRARRQR